MIITGNYTLQANPNWKLLQLQEIYLECDTTLTGVNITLPEIASMGGFFNVKIYVSDFANNASVNNINIVVSGSDTIDASPSVTINTNGGSAVIAITSPTQWICLESNAGGGGVGFITVTKAALDALILSNSLVAGSFYRVLGVDVPLYGGTDIIVQAVSSNKISEDGTGFFYNPKYSTVGIYNPYVVVDIGNTTGELDFNETFTSNNGTTGSIVGYCATGQRAFLLTQNLSGIAASISITGDNSGETADITIFSVPNYVSNDRVIWGGVLWSNVNGNLGTATNLYNLNVDWSAIAFNTTDYNYVADAIKYDYANDFITYRYEENAGNSVLETYADNFIVQNFFLLYISRAIKAFQWGNPYNINTFTGNGSNKVENSYFECINFDTQEIIYNEFTQLSLIYNVKTVNNNNARFTGNKFMAGSYFYDSTIIDFANFIGNQFYGGSLAKDITVQNAGITDNLLNISSQFDNLLLFNTQIGNNYLNNNSFIGNINATDSSVEYNTLDRSNIQDNNLRLGSYIGENTLSNFSQITNNTLSNSTIVGNTLSNSSISVNTISNSSSVYYNNLVVNSQISSNLLDSGTSVQSNSLSLASGILGNNFNSNCAVNFNTLIELSRIQNNTGTNLVVSENILSTISFISYNTFENLIVGLNNLSNQSYIAFSSKTGVSTGRIERNTFETSSWLSFNALDNTEINSNKITNNSNIDERVAPQLITIGDNIIDNYSTIIDNTYLLNRPKILKNTITNSSSINSNTLDGSEITRCTVSNSSAIIVNNIGSNCSIRDCSLDKSTITGFIATQSTNIGNYILQNSNLVNWDLTSQAFINSTPCNFINIVLNNLLFYPTQAVYIGMPEFANNAAALAGNMPIGGLYRVTGTGTVQIVI